MTRTHHAARELDRRELAEQWRLRALVYDQHARHYRADGDPVAAAELEEVAGDYRAAADELEYGLESAG